MAKLAIKIGAALVGLVVLLYFYLGMECRSQAEKYGREGAFGFTTGCLMKTPFGVWVPLKRHSGAVAGHH